MMRQIREKISVVLCLFFLFMNLFSDRGYVVRADTSGKPELTGLYAYAYCLMDADSGRVLVQKHGNERLAMASTTKIMTLIVVLENTSPDEVVTVSSNAAAQPDVQLNICTGEKYRVGDLVYSLMLESHNDVAVALAEHVGGSVEGFAALMNAKAAELGLTDTNFVTPNGLDAEGHYTTAVELAKITAYAIQNEQFLKIIGTTSYQFNEVNSGRSFMVRNKNRFLYMMDGAIGVKTGFTGKAGYCFVGALDRGHHKLISVVLASGWPPHKEYKWRDTVKLMEYGLGNYIKRNIYDRADVMINHERYTGTISEYDADKIIPKEIPVNGGIKESVAVGMEKTLSDMPEILMGEWEEPRIEVEYDTVLTAPVSAGQVAGFLTVEIGDEVIAELPICTQESIPCPDYPYCLYKLFLRWLNL